MNNRPIDLKAVMFTLTQLQDTLDVLTRAHNPIAQTEYSGQAYFNPVDHNPSIPHHQDKSRS